MAEAFGAEFTRDETFVAGEGGGSSGAGNVGGELVARLAVNDHAGGDSGIRIWINEDKAAGGAVALVGIKAEGGDSGKDDAADFVEGKGLSGLAFEGIDIDAVAHLIHADAGGFGCVFNDERAVDIHGGVVHPDQHGLEVAFDAGEIVAVDEHVTAADIAFILEGDADGHRGKGFFEVAILGDDARDTADGTGREDHDFIATANDA